MTATRVNLLRGSICFFSTAIVAFPEPQYGKHMHTREEGLVNITPL